MLQIDPEEHKDKLFKIISGGVAPRPIAFAATVDKEGNHNLSPFSFYNAFGVNPSTLIFSPARRGRDNTTKHTFENIKEVPEVTINAVSYSMVHQMSLSSTEYAKGVDEFIKAGFTSLESNKIRPRRVAESPLQFECKVRDIIETSGKPGSGNLIICEIVYIHIDENILDKNGDIDHNKIDLVGRLGGDHYVRTSGNASFTIQKPLTTLGIGVDALPENIRMSHYLTGNDLGQLGNLENMPTNVDIEAYLSNVDPVLITKSIDDKHEFAHSLITAGKIKEALMLLISS